MLEVIFQNINQNHQNKVLKVLKGLVKCFYKNCLMTIKYYLTKKI